MTEYVYQPYPRWVHHPEALHPSELVLDEDAEAAIFAKWNITADDANLATDSARDLLLKRAEVAGLKVDNRWSDKKLAAEVEKAEGPVDLTTYKAPLV